MKSEDRRFGAYKPGGLAPLVLRFQLVQTSQPPGFCSGLSSLKTHMFAMK